MTKLAAPALLAALAFVAGPAPFALADTPAALLSAPYTSEPPLVRQTPDEIRARLDALVIFPTELDRRIWTADHRMRPEISARSMEIVNRLFNGLKLRNRAVNVADIELFGSNASYEYDDEADLAIHVFLSTAGNPAAYAEDVLDLEHFMRLLNDAIELRQQNELRFFGIPVTITFHATRGPGLRDSDGLPQYSIWSSDPARTGRWINPKDQPPAPPKNAFDKTVVAGKAQGFVTQYNALVIDYFNDKQGFDCSRFLSFGNAIKSYRADSIAADGQRSSGNLTYRLLRRLDVNVPEEAQALQRECLNIKASLF